MTAVLTVILCLSLGTKTTNVASLSTMWQTKNIKLDSLTTKMPPGFTLSETSNSTTIIAVQLGSKALPEEIAAFTFNGTYANGNKRLHSSDRLSEQLLPSSYQATTRKCLARRWKEPQQRNNSPQLNLSGNGKANNSALSYYNYPFNQYALPECATQQVCNALYTRLDRINGLCACPEKFGGPCSISFTSDDAHTIELVTDSKSGKALTLIKTCEPIAAVRECRGLKDWSLLALQNVRTGKSHYLVVCRCIHDAVLEGPIAHENPPYAKIPGIRVFGMVCIQNLGKNKAQYSGKRGGSQHMQSTRMIRMLRGGNLPGLLLDKLKHLITEKPSN